MSTDNPEAPAGKAHTLVFPRLWQLVGWLLVATVVTATLVPEPPEVGFMPASDKVLHLLAYGGLALWFRQAFASRLRWVVFLIMLGILLEFIQGWSGYRSFEYADMLANALGVGCGLLLAATPLGLTVPWLDRTLQSLRTT
jgi:VanZ family protein